MNKRLRWIFIIFSAVLILVVLAVFIYNGLVREVVETTITIPMTTTPVSAYTSNLPIHGLNLDNAIPILEGNDFICSEKPEAFQNEYYRVSCEQKTQEYDMLVHVLTSDQKNIILVDAQINQFNKPSDDQAVNFLGFITRLPIDGLDASALKQWIKITLPTLDKSPGLVAAQTLDGLELSLYGTPQNRSLEIMVKK